MMKKFTLILFALFTFISTGYTQILDGSFEAGAPNPSWNEASINFGTPLCDQGSCGTCGGPCTPNTGTWYSWFGGIGGVTETASVDQTVVIPVGTTAEVSMFVKIAIPSGVAMDRVEVSVDGNVEGTVFDADSITYANYAQFVVDISAYADGSPHNIRIEGFQTTTTLVNILADDVVLTVDGINVGGLFEGGDIQASAVLYPNPATDVVNLQFGEVSNDPITISIATMDGKIVEESTLRNAGKKNFEFDTSALSMGVYMVNVVQNNASILIDRLVITGVE